MLDRYVWLYPDGDLDQEPELWQRTGECTRCGLCCTGPEMRYATTRETLSQDEIERRIERRKEGPLVNYGWQLGVPIAVEQWNGENTWWQRKLSEETRVCKRYEGDGVCRGYDNDRPEICRKWPILPSDVEPYPKCGYRFERVESKEE